MAVATLQDDVGEGSPAPERERLSTQLDRLGQRSRAGGLQQPLELREVERPTVEDDPVPRRPSLEDAVAELLAQRVDVALDELVGGRGRPLPQSSSTSRAVETTSFACRSRTPRSARCLAAPSRTVSCPSRTSSGPRIRNSIAPPPERIDRTTCSNRASTRHEPGRNQARGTSGRHSKRPGRERHHARTERPAVAVLVVIARARRGRDGERGGRRRGSEPNAITGSWAVTVDRGPAGCSARCSPSPAAAQ